MMLLSIILKVKVIFMEAIKSISNFVNVLASGTQGANAVDPLYDAISTIGPYAIGVVLVLGIIYGIIIGVKFAKAEDAKERAALQKVLVNGIIGFVAVVVLLGILYAIRGPLVTWMNS